MPADLRNPRNRPLRRRLLLARFTVACVLVTAGLVLSRTAADTSRSPAAANDAASPAGPSVAHRPAVPGRLNVRLRSRVETEQGSGRWHEVVRDEQWHVSQTAIIICDMWDDHYCQSAAQRVDEMAPRMNSVLTAARNHGVLIIHAPSGCMDVYADTPYRRRMQLAPAAKPPVPIAGWCHLDPEVEPELPVDTSQEACDDPVVGPRVRRYSKQHEAVRIIGYDGVSDSGAEIFNVCHALGIRNVVLVGVHTNMCVLGRPFGIRQLVRLGFNVALARDLTDAMYDPRQPPHVSHTRGTELVVEHIEKFWCPSLDSDDLTKVIAGSADPQPAVSADPQPAVNDGPKPHEPATERSNQPDLPPSARSRRTTAPLQQTGYPPLPAVRVWQGFLAGMKVVSGLGTSGDEGRRVWAFAGLQASRYSTALRVPPARGTSITISNPCGIASSPRPLRPRPCPASGL